MVLGARAQIFLRFFGSTGWLAQEGIQPLAFKNSRAIIALKPEVPCKMLHRPHELSTKSAKNVRLAGIKVLCFLDNFGFELLVTWIYFFGLTTSQPLIRDELESYPSGIATRRSTRRPSQATSQQTTTSLRPCTLVQVSFTHFSPYIFLCWLLIQESQFTKNFSVAFEILEAFGCIGW